jgi:hypothetical protein
MRELHLAKKPMHVSDQYSAFPLIGKFSSSAIGR